MPLELSLEQLEQLYNRGERLRQKKVDRAQHSSLPIQSFVLEIWYRTLTEERETGLFNRTADRERQGAGEQGLMQRYARTDFRKFSFSVRTVNS
jgi:hypothetical protein